MTVYRWREERESAVQLASDDVQYYVAHSPHACRGVLVFPSRRGLGFVHAERVPDYPGKVVDSDSLRKVVMTGVRENGRSDVTCSAH